MRIDNLLVRLYVNCIAIFLITGDVYLAFHECKDTKLLRNKYMMFRFFSFFLLTFAEQISLENVTLPSDFWDILGLKMQ